MKVLFQSPDPLYMTLGQAVWAVILLKIHKDTLWRSAIIALYMQMNKCILNRSHVLLWVWSYDNFTCVVFAKRQRKLERSMSLLVLGWDLKPVKIFVVSWAVVLNLFYVISHFATPNLNIPPPPCNEFLRFVINTTIPRNIVGALRLAYWTLCIRYKPIL